MKLLIKSKPRKAKGAANRTKRSAGSQQRMVRALALALAMEYATGWKSHAAHVGEMPGMPAETWAECNWQTFTEKAERILRPSIQVGCATEKVAMPDITEQEAKDEAERIRVIHEHMTK